VFVESGTFIEDTSTIRFSGTTPSVKQTPYYNLVIDTDRGGTVTATAPTIGLQVLNNLTIGVLGTSTLNANTNDPTFAVSNTVLIGSRVPLKQVTARRSRLMVTGIMTEFILPWRNGDLLKSGRSGFDSSG
jgi:hypothetical protein